MQVVLVYLQPFCCNSVLKCSQHPNIAKNSLKILFGKVQGYSRSSMLINPKSLSPVLVMISSMSVPICNRFHATRDTSKVIEVHLQNFKPIFAPFWKKMYGGLQSPLGGVLVRLGHSLARVKIWKRSTPYRPKYGLSKKCALGGYDFTSRSLRLLDKSSPNLFRLTREELR